MKKLKLLLTKVDDESNFEFKSLNQSVSNRLNQILVGSNNHVCDGNGTCSNNDECVGNGVCSGDGCCVNEQ